MSTLIPTNGASPTLITVYETDHLVIVILVYALIQKEIFFLFIVFAALAPIGLIITIGYHFIKRLVIQAKTQRLALILEKATENLERIPRRITKYDTDLSIRTGFIWQGILSPFLLGTMRLLAQAKYMIISEQLGRGKNWSTETSANSPPAILADRTRKIAQAIRTYDYVSAYEAIGELLALPLFYNTPPRQGEIEFTNENFLNLCRKTASLLRERRLLDADQLIDSLIENIKEEGPTNIENTKWQVLIVYWIWLRLSFLKTPDWPRPTWFWAGPSKLLAEQVDAILDSYGDQDFAEIAEIVNESFDWRTRVPRFIL